MFRKQRSRSASIAQAWKWVLFALALALTAGAMLAANGIVSAAMPSTKVSVPSQAAPRSSSLVISELYGGGGNSGAYWRNDFVELFNPTQSTVSFTNWSIQYQSATGNGIWTQVNPITGTIPAGGYFLVQLAAGANTSATPLP